MSEPRVILDTDVASLSAKTSLTYDFLSGLKVRDFADFAEHERRRLILPPEPE